ncbi:hypothetical protein IHE45_09G037400 [Dioscorea alata]|uniref:Uncharacterized protein n=1 Tax=Dioscorea alata TaxID=55571 RepID=A0ACB7VEI0_DIOAL|nr:hypothetical protein IHE45_09G037400 [Dioscorea alata]
MNDLVFVMYNLKLKDKVAKKNDEHGQGPFEEQDFDDEWITEENDQRFSTSSSQNWVNVLNSQRSEESREDGTDGNEVAFNDIDNHNKHVTPLEIHDFEPSEFVRELVDTTQDLDFGNDIDLGLEIGASDDGDDTGGDDWRDVVWRKVQMIFFSLHFSFIILFVVSPFMYFC